MYRFRTMAEILCAVYLTALIFLGGCATQKTAPSPAKVTGIELVVLHTNDTHSYVAGINAHGNACFNDANCRGGMARIAWAISAFKNKQDNVIALDAGDQFQGTLFFTVNSWPMLAHIDQHMPYDAMTLGNHEFDINCRTCAHFIAKVPFPVVAANLAPQPGCPLLGANYQPWIIKKIRGQKVGIIGLANDEVVTLAAACPQTRFHKAKDSLKAAVDKLQAQGVTHIIALTHLGLPTDRALARAVDGVDVIVGGHTHSYLGKDSDEGPYPIVERSPSGKNVLVVTAKRSTEYLGQLTVGFDTSGNVVNWSGEAVELGVDAPREPVISKLVADYAKPLDKYRKQAVGELKITGIADGMDQCRQGDCLTGMIMTDAMLEYASPYKAAAALINGGSIRAALPSGKLTRGDVLQAQPFSNACVLRDVTGAQLLKALEHGVAGADKEKPQILQASGLRYWVDLQKPDGSRVTKVEMLNAQGEPTSLDTGKTYRIVTLEYIARGGDGYEVFKKAKIASSPDEVDAIVLEKYLKKHSPLQHIRTGRINFVQ